MRASQNENKLNLECELRATSDSQRRLGFQSRLQGGHQVGQQGGPQGVLQGVLESFQMDSGRGNMGHGSGMVSAEV